MQSPIASLVFAAVALAATYTVSPFQRAREDASYVPSKFVIEIGGFGGPSYKVEMREGKIHYRAETWAPKQEVVEKVITPTKEQWRSFWQEAEKAQVWQWSQEYFNREIADGTQWRVSIEQNGRTVIASGSNSYPAEGDVAKSNKSPEPSAPFNRFIKAVHALIGNLPFQ